MNTTTTSRFPTAFLFLNGVFWVAYALFCLFQPDFIHGLLALSPSPASLTEFGAMYGGAQFGLGVYWITTALQKNRTECGLLSFVLLTGSLATARAIGLFLNGPDDYNNFGFAYEFPAMLIGIFCLIKARQQTPGSA